MEEGRVQIEHRARANVESLMKKEKRRIDARHTETYTDTDRQSDGVRPRRYTPTH
ncbi:hypothetical protein HYPSUDRAFT_49463 [Hypholoma sublateritium FD-334 SS-4]|uniref:Uncharacterized protein n=1 Tax=Hypholoma sublateritium (strain FD-334 SS-4) TaxID=945553 RepID=A0A0D2KHE7_HYPSF|nr:hypothetical protein HYPSUDRAFT_49463 [Hypholoma sublateritium FD-334 SS-4]